MSSGILTSVRDPDYTKAYWQDDDGRLRWMICPDCDDHGKPWWEGDNPPTNTSNRGVLPYRGGEIFCYRCRYHGQARGVDIPWTWFLER